MNTLIASLYNVSPIFVQNTMMSLYGAYLYRLRHGRTKRHFREFLRQTECYSWDQIRNLQRQGLGALLQKAYENVGYYRKAFDDRGLKPADIKDVDDLQKLPILTKDEIREHPEQFISNAVGTRRLAQVNTSGTTGTPLTFYASKEELQKHYAFFDRALEWAGVRIGDRSATFAGRVFIPKRQEHPPYWRNNLVMNNVLFSSYHISPQTILSYVQKLEHIAPVFIDSYPSAIYAIAQYLLEHRIRHKVHPKAIVTSSETLLDHQREAIQEAFGCKVFDLYSSAEMVAFVSQCEHGSYHISPEYGIVEILKDGEPVMPGDPGELICTGFMNYSMPLIRYKIGDTAAASQEPCSCGRQFPVLHTIIGRTDDVIQTKDGRLVGRLDPIFKGARGIKETQIIQRSLDEIVLRVVRGKDYSVASLDAVVSALRDRVGDSIIINVEFSDEIERTRSGKFRAVVSLINQNRSSLANLAPCTIESQNSDQ